MNASSQLRRFSAIRWAFLRWLCLGIAAGAVFLALGYGIENWRGGRAWSVERAEVARRGTPILREELVPPPVPDDQDLAQSPPFPLLFDYRRDPVTGRQSNTNLEAALAWCDVEGISGAPGFPGVGGVWAGILMGTNPVARKLDLEALAAYFRAPAKLEKRLVKRTRARYGLPMTVPPAGQAAPSGFPMLDEPGTAAEDILKALSLFDADMASLAEAARRPHVRFPVRYEEGQLALLPHLPMVKRLCNLFTLRAVARLEAGQVEGAFEDVRTAWRIAEAPRKEPLTISQLVRYSAMSTALQPVWEGVTRHRWNPAQLEQIQAWLGNADLEGGIRLALAGERTIGAENIVLTILGSPEGRRAMAAMLDDLDIGPDAGTGGRGFGSIYLAWAPRGWLYASLAEISRALRMLETASPAELSRLHAHWPPPPPSRSRRYLLYQAYFGTGPGENRVEPVLAGYRAQAQVRLARLACALERYRLETGSYPDRIESLVPRWIEAIPADPMDGRPLRYSLEGADRFRAWSVGANARDDGGVRALADVPLRSLDWIWGWPGS